MDHITQATALIEVGGETNLRYAALEIRMAIEILFYKLVPQYKDELPDDILKQWRPKAILDAVLDCDPNAEHDSSVSFAQEVAGETPSNGTFLGNHKAVSRKLLRNYYHFLGSILHASNDKSPLDLDKAKRRLLSACSKVKEHCEQTTLFFNIGNYATYKCDCGRIIKRNSNAIKHNPIVQCTNSQCRATYKVTLDSDKTAFWVLMQQEFICPKCKTSSYLREHELRPGAMFKCVECKQGYQLEAVLHVKDAGPTLD